MSCLRMEFAFSISRLSAKASRSAGVLSFSSCSVMRPLATIGSPSVIVVAGVLVDASAGRPRRSRCRRRRSASARAMSSVSGCRSMRTMGAVARRLERREAGSGDVWPCGRGDRRRASRRDAASRREGPPRIPERRRRGEPRGGPSGQADALSRSVELGGHRQHHDDGDQEGDLVGHAPELLGAGGGPGGEALARLAQEAVPAGQERRRRPAWRSSRAGRGSPSPAPIAGRRNQISADPEDPGQRSWPG